MKNRTDFVNIGWKEQLAQQLRTYRDGLQTLLWGVLGLVVGLGNMMLEVSPFGAALCAAVPLQHLLPAAIGSAAGSLLLSSLSQLGGAHVFTIKYAAAIILIAAARKTLEKNNLLGGWVEQRWIGAPLLAFAGMLLPSLAVLFAAPFTMYNLVMAFAEATLAGACAYFLSRSISVFALGQGMFTLQRADMVSVVLTGAVLIVSLSNVTLGGISLGRLIAAAVVLICALIGGERWGAVAGIVCGTAVSAALFPKMQLLGIYALAGLAAGVFSGLGRFGCAGGYAMTFGALSVITATPPVLPLLYETLITTVGLMLLPPRAIQALRTRIFRVPANSADKSVRRLMLDRLEDASQALREIAQTTQLVSQKLDAARAGSIEQVYDHAVDQVCRKCGLKMRCWQQEYGDSANVFNQLTSVLRQKGSVCAEDFAYPLSARCNRREQLCQEINSGYQQLTAKEGISRKVSRVRSVVTDQFEGLAQLLSGLGEELGGISSNEEQTMARVMDYLEESRQRAQRADCYRDEQGRLFVQLDFAVHKEATMDVEQMTRELSRICDCEFDLPQRTLLREEGTQGQLVRFSFREQAMYQVEFASSQHICQGYRTCGDACQSFTDRRAIAHMVLSDGMGSGTAAAVDSNMTVSLLTKLIDAGVNYSAALKIVNSALLVKSGEESLSTIDITAIDLYTGQASFFKAGAAPTFVRRGKRTGSVESASLPAGILTSVEFEKSGIRLSSGDLVVMVSDGAVSSGTDWIRASVEHFGEKDDLQSLCDDIATTARLRRNDEHDDDITVMACRVKDAVL